ncbi:secreted antigen 1 [Babesia divergens]|uniref:Secreted antigen 1 n=1 Tax=Babesia divergens TaxID=32595 RepID=A0AAD9LKY1_BABDI|nr:secreted antigen 1 [Babesia divergens]
MSETCDFKEPGTLKDILVELYKLHGMAKTRPKVFEQLRTYLETYCSVSYLNDFYSDQSGMYGSSSGVSYSGGGTILLLTQASQKVGDIIFQKSPTDGRSVDTHVSHKDQNCHVKIAEALKKCLPKTFAALFFLFFNVSNDCKGFGGGSWNTLKVNESGQNLKNWLIGGSGSDLPGGFSGGDLNTSNTGKNVAEKLKEAVSLNPDTNNGSLQNVLCGFMFVCKWDDALLGHALLFLSKFCEKVGSDYLQEGGETFNKYKEKFERKFNGSFDEMQKRCNEVNNGLRPFTLGLGNTETHLSAVCSNNSGLFNDLWDDKYFEDYVKWLKENLHHIIGSLQSMSSDCTQWDSSNLQGAKTAGPFRFGFVFKDSSWTSSSTFKSHLPPEIKTLTASLKKLLADLLFVFPWDPSLLGHALCFLYKFCSKVQDGSLEGKLKGYSGDLKTVCKTLMSPLQPFIFGTSGLFAVCKSNTTLFDGIWDDNKFDKYCEWLRKHLKNIIEALKDMSEKCKQWTKGKLKDASSAGPSRFGFVFKDDSWEGKINSELPSKISPLTDSAAHSGSLKKLKECLEPSSSTAAAAAGAAGGLFGLGGAGAGAAYATNAFGFQNLVTSFISSFLK